MYRGLGLFMIAACLTVGVVLPSAATSYSPVKMRALFEHSDAVVFARVTSGMMTPPNGAVFEARVTDALKGLAVDDRFTFGPYSGKRVGREYLLFLKRSTDSSSDPGSSGAGETLAAFAPAYSVLFVGFGSMEVVYTCPFEECEECVDVPVRHVPIPRSIKASPHDDPRSRATDHAWVKRRDLLKYLSKLARKRAGR